MAKTDFTTITSRDNALIKDVCRLMSSAKYRREKRAFVLEGLRLCRDAVRTGITPETVLMTVSFFDSHTADAQEIYKNCDSTFLVSDAVAKKLGDTETPQGIFAVVPMPSPVAFAENGKYIGLENVQDPSNLGAVARSAEAFGISALILFGNTCDPFSPKAQRAAMGALLRLPVYQFASFSDFKTACPECKSYAAVVSGGNKPDAVDFSAPSITVVGNEANGLTPDTAGQCDKKLTIPMKGRAESLNAAVAASVIIWEMTK